MKYNFDDFARLVFDGCLNIAANDEICHNKSGIPCKNCGNMLTIRSRRLKNQDCIKENKK